MKLVAIIVVVVVVALVVVALSATSATAAAPVCKAPAGFVEYTAYALAPKNASEACIAVARDMGGRISFTFEDGVYTGAPATQTTAKSACGVMVQLDVEEGEQERGIVVKWDASWYRGRGFYLVEGCELALIVVRN